ncbi:hypothetical protein I79_009492 [Cricetulus griseus]|uniref:Uncharacterized protein n=1 Tax=Cricetulus griseus TaxID=10029 RepID=G3HFX5_CRIGR|nr:hypothetical protein I79_009492 [Cricetulus griseus]
MDCAPPTPDPSSIKLFHLMLNFHQLRNSVCRMNLSSYEGVCVDKVYMYGYSLQLALDLFVFPVNSGTVRLLMT